jgi:hypothetical protein
MVLDKYGFAYLTEAHYVAFVLLEESWRWRQESQDRARLASIQD